jgi:hypothetical protein
VHAAVGSAHRATTGDDLIALAGTGARVSQWNFAAAPNAAVFTTRRVLNQDAGVVRVILDDEGDWQALDAFPRAEGDAVVIALRSLVDLHPEVRGAVGELDQLGWGWQARRGDARGWHFERYAS